MASGDVSEFVCNNAHHFVGIFCFLDETRMNENIRASGDKGIHIGALDQNDVDL